MPSPRPLGQLLCPEATPWLLWALGADPKHPAGKMIDFLGDKWATSSKVLIVTKVSLEQEFSNVAHFRVIWASAAGPNQNPSEG